LFDQYKISRSFFVVNQGTSIGGVALLFKRAIHLGKTKQSPAVSKMLRDPKTMLLSPTLNLREVNVAKYMVKTKHIMLRVGEIG